MNSFELNRQHGQIVALIAQTRAVCGDNLELQGHWGQYLCVMTAGFLENAIAEVYSEFAARNASKPVAGYATTHLLAIQNPNTNKFIDTAKAFKPEWGDQLETFVSSEGRKDAIDAVMANRHQIAHGQYSGISVARIDSYLRKCVEVIEFIEGQTGHVIRAVQKNK